MTIVQQIAEDVGDAGLRLRKVTPRGTDRLLLGLEDPTGKVLAGQWHRDGAEAARVAEETRKAGHHGDVTSLPRTGALIQRNGVDRRLPALQRLSCAGGASLVSHRAERRAVVREPSGDYVKVVPPKNVRGLVESLSRIDAGSALSVPQIVDVDAGQGTVRTKPLPGRTFHARLADCSLSDDELAADSRAIGVALREFHRMPAPARSSVHDATAELEVTARWLDLAKAYGLSCEPVCRPLLEKAATLLDSAPGCHTQVHRDLHDKQLMIAEDMPVGLLDLDLRAVGEPAIDLANLLVHLELRGMQGHCTWSRAESCVRGLLDGYAPAVEARGRLAGYLVTSRLRLATVYSFRDPLPGLVHALVSRANEQELLP